jgi:hypothetical protein
MNPARSLTFAGALALAALATACSGFQHPPATHGHSSSPGAAPQAAQLTVRQAASAFAAFLPQFNQLSSSPSGISQVTAGPETAVQTYAKGAGPAAGNLSGTRFLVPELTSYPRWFLAAGTGSGRGFLFVMVQQSESAPWKEAAELYDLSAPPQIMPDLTEAGFGASAVAAAVPAQGAPLTIQPDQLSADYALYLNDKGHGAQRDSFLAGAFTTGLVSLDHTASSGAAAAGWRFSDHQSATTLPAYGLQLPSGVGAAIVFYTTDAVSWTARSSTARMPTASSQSEAIPPLPFLQQLGVTSPRAGLRVTATAVDENLAFVGPPGTNGATIVVNVGHAYRVTRN